MAPLDGFIDTPVIVIVGIRAVTFVPNGTVTAIVELPSFITVPPTWLGIVKAVIALVELIGEFVLTVLASSVTAVCANALPFSVAPVFNTIAV